jgi:hypothetical protein
MSCKRWSVEPAVHVELNLGPGLRIAAGRVARLMRFASVADIRRRSTGWRRPSLPQNVYVCWSNVLPSESVGVTVTCELATVTSRKWNTCAVEVGATADPHLLPAFLL